MLNAFMVAIATVVEHVHTHAHAHVPMYQNLTPSQKKAYTSIYVSTPLVCVCTWHVSYVYMYPHGNLKRDDRYCTLSPLSLSLNKNKNMFLSSSLGYVVS